jgi:hypothetical protein
MTRLAPLSSFQTALSRSEDHAQGGVHTAELEALRHVDVVADPGALDAVAVLALAGAPSPERSAEELRLPPPPVRAPDGFTLYSKLGQSVARFEATRDEQLPVSAEAALAEHRAMALCASIYDLEREIREKIGRSRPV